jgi:hypothetical protein
VLADELAPWHLADGPELLALVGELGGGLLGNYPALGADLELDISRVRVEPDVGDAEYRLGAERGRREEQRRALPVQPVFHQRELVDAHALSLQEVVVGDRLVVPGAELHRVGAGGDQPLLPELAVLPLHHLAEVRVEGGALAAPVDGVAQRAHAGLVAHPATVYPVVCELQGLGQAGPDVLRDAVLVREYGQVLGLAVLDALGGAHDGTAC